MIPAMSRLKKEYYDWRTWNYFYRNIKKQPNIAPKTISRPVPYLKKPGIAFSFDDSFRVNDWYKYGKNMFGFYDVKVTFNVNAFHHYEDNREHSQKEIDMLLDLQANGHEIAHHGYNHKNAVEYSDQMGLNQWIEDEIISLFDWLEKQSHSSTGEKFKKPVTFAFPYFSFNEQILTELVPKYFKIARGHFFNGQYLTPAEHSGFGPSICIDSHYLSNPKNIAKVINFVKETNYNLILTCHSILPDEVNWGEYGWPMDEHAKRWRTSPKVIKSIINEVRKNDLAFYTTSELAGVATFIDQNFERYVRKLLSKDPNEWILITELSSIKKLDLSGRNISNLDGIHYFPELEKINISNNNITDYRLLKNINSEIKVIL
ncbi:polysaccharide deacetylase family protein [Evansella sp. LMS18]|uniref:polysaccharide deacetylase family protein n=1 Tax=Evansella sp. LMS18 TaxID=2924033 RepID=UPI0020D149E9|nr:polysaccharide deacetylase family protein [Evansella sp. LMS18]UTR10564.1 polysaccharide deacetylase family protein [Evansella sp. LMS18]